MNPNKKVWDWRSYILHYAPDNSTYKHLLLTLSCYMDSSGGSCFPSISTLEDVSSLSRPTIVKYLKKAKKDGWLCIDQHGYGGKKWKRNEYTASVPDKVVKELNQKEQGSKTAKEGSKTDNGRRLNSLQKVVKEVNSISTYNTPSNSPMNSGKDDFSETLKRMQNKYSNGSG